MNHPRLPATALILVEDNETLRNELQYSLSQEGFDVRAVDGGEALNAALHQRPADILVLDLNMAEEDGISIAKRIRIAMPEVGIVMLTARVRSIDREEGYQSGADVYMTKPARPAELAAAILNLSGRLKPKSAACLWVLSMGLLTLRYQQSAPIDITENEAKLLKVLAMSGTCVSHNELQELMVPLQQEDALSRTRLEVLISRLRTKLSLHMGQVNPIRSVRGRGYQLCLAVQIQ